MFSFVSSKINIAFFIQFRYIKVWYHQIKQISKRKQSFVLRYAKPTTLNNTDMKIPQTFMFWKSRCGSKQKVVKREKSWKFFLFCCKSVLLLAEQSEHIVHLDRFALFVTQALLKTLFIYCIVTYKPVGWPLHYTGWLF